MPKFDLLIGLLYLVNLFEPVSDAVLKSEFEKFAKTVNRSGTAPVAYRSLLGTLEQRRFVVQTKGRYSLTHAGLSEIEIAGLSRARDKNRLFILKDLL
jgi:hypothetical protein